jgi:hypothetical protein
VVGYEALSQEFAEVVQLRGAADLSRVLKRLPGLLSRATNHAHAVDTPEAWAMVANIYSTVYWLAARHRWMDLAELAVVKQRLAADRANPWLRLLQPETKPEHFSIPGTSRADWRSLTGPLLRPNLR